MFFAPLNYLLPPVLRNGEWHMAPKLPENKRIVPAPSIQFKDLRNAAAKIPGNMQVARVKFLPKDALCSCFYRLT
jgi:hypothetical protein